MRALLLSTLLATALAAWPSYARPGDGGRRPGDGGPRQRDRDRDEDRDDDDRKRDAKQAEDVDLSPWIQAWAREGIKGKALTQRLERLMEQKRAGKLPPPPGMKEDEDRGPRGRGGFGPPGRFGGFRGGPGDGGPGMRWGGRGMGRGPGMMPGGPRMQRGPGMMGGGRPQAQKDGERKPDAAPEKNAGPNAEMMRDMKAQIGKLREELERLERRMDSAPGKGAAKEAQPSKPKKPQGDADEDRGEKKGEGDKPKKPGKRGGDEE